MNDPEKNGSEKRTENDDEETDKTEKPAVELAPPIRGGYFDRISAKLREAWHPRRR
jgi:hypothetical protein